MTNQDKEMARAGVGEDNNNDNDDEDNDKEIGDQDPIVPMGN